MVAKGFEFYDAKYRYWRKRLQLMGRFRALAEEVSKDVVGSVLDLGCGFGFLADFVKGPYLGVDFSPVAIWGAREMSPSVEFVVGDLRHFTPTVAFDTVVLLEVLEHLDNPAQAVELARQWATQRIVVSVPRHMPGGGHIWPTWTEEDVARLLGPGAKVRRYRRWEIGVWTAI